MTPLCSPVLRACSGAEGASGDWFQMEGGKARGRGCWRWGDVSAWACRLPRPWQPGCHVGWAGGALSPREQAGFGGSRLCLHLPHTPGPRSPPLLRALPPLGSLHSLHIGSSCCRVATLGLERLYGRPPGTEAPLPRPTISCHSSW